jgi:hypothetical protein
MSPAALVQDEEYVSEEDSDFAPADAPGEESASSDDDEAAVAENNAPRKRKVRDGDEGAEVAGFENSGDEAIIERGKKRQRKSKRRDGRPDADADADEDEGGEGGLVKTRRMRAAEYATRQSPNASSC